MASMTWRRFVLEHSTEHLAPLPEPAVVIDLTDPVHPTAEAAVR